MLRNLKSFNLPEIEEKVLAFWKEKQIFEKTLKPNRAGTNGKTFHFWEGPPTANGRPGIHHVLARSFKDVVLRFKTMRGFVVPRKGGWDTHGLPVELQVEKQLGFTSKKEIERFGIAKFNQKCKESVWLYKSEWEKLTERMGLWLDIKHPYVTYHNDYIESLWWTIKQIWDGGYMYQGNKVVPWCPRCGTALSSHELAQGYEEVTDTSVYIRFKIKPKQRIGSFVSNAATYILSWTTTPWTLPGNVALAVGKDIRYAIVLKGRDTYILAENLLSHILPEGKILKTCIGSDLVGTSYDPLFHIKPLQQKSSYKIYAADFVTTEDGTGVVHTAVMYGEDDYQLGKSLGLVQYHTVDERGNFTKDVEGFFGLYVKSKGTEEKILEYLKKNDSLFSSTPYTHDYPHCWRCSTPLLYYARHAWFVAMSKLKRKLITSNNAVHWIPAHIKKGRFGEWLFDVKDWNFSRERYWGTPLPIWTCKACQYQKAFGSFEEITKILPKSKTTYVLVRHGQAGHNVSRVVNGDPKKKDIYHITAIGKKQSLAAARLIQKMRRSVDLVFSSDFVRTRETARIIADELGIQKIQIDIRLREIYSGTFEGESIQRYSDYFSSLEERFVKRPPEGENLRDVASRAYAFVNEMEKKHFGKTILVVGHGDLLWMLKAVLLGWSQERTISEIEKRDGESFLSLGGMDVVLPVAVSRDDEGFADCHIPFIDRVTFPCEKCGSIMKRIPEVADVWFDSGAMPFAQNHWPFSENQKSKAKRKNLPDNYPADYICEAVDQTRGWFYTLLAVATLLGHTTPYKNVVCLGHINDKHGQKMSKSKGNVVDPWAMVHKYGIDAIRWYFYTANDPGEPKNFDEADIQKAIRKFLLVAYNSFSFLALYGKKGLSLTKHPVMRHVLDAWICARLSETETEVLRRMDKYELFQATQALEIFTDDLSRWYIRRSRRRLQKNDDKKDWEQASFTLAYVLVQYVKLLAPFVPFFSEALYQSLKKFYPSGLEESVHLEFLVPQKAKRDTAFMDAMGWVRNTASGVLAQRSELHIKVRQPLSRLSVRHFPKSKRLEDILEILKDEINVKNVVQNALLKTEFELDTHITPELKAEGQLREFIRIAQDLRQEAGYVPKDGIELYISSDETFERLIFVHSKMLERDLGAQKIIVGKSNKIDVQSDTKIDDHKIWIGIRREKRRVANKK